MKSPISKIPNYSFGNPITRFSSICYGHNFIRETAVKNISYYNNIYVYVYIYELFIEVTQYFAMIFMHVGVIISDKLHIMNIAIYAYSYPKLGVCLITNLI